MRLDVAQNFERKQGGKPMKSTEIQKMTEGAMVERINAAKFPQELKPEEKRLLAMAAITYGFDPVMGELIIYQGRPFVSIDGRYRKARETGNLDGVTTRPATKQEREDWSIPEGDYFFRSDVKVKGMSLPLTGWGRVRAAESQGKGFKPIDTNPQRMAEKRAEAQALRKAFSIPLPSTEEIGGEAEEEAPKLLVTVEPPACPSTSSGQALADPETGEVIEEGEVVEQVSGKALDH